MAEWIVAHVGLTWLAIAVALAIAELFSLDFVLLMLAIGALGAAGAATLGAPAWGAIIVFILVSGALLGLARPPLVARLHGGPTLSTGFQNLVGQPALVLSPVDLRDGRVRIGSEEWSARTEGGTIGVGTEARVVRIEGATAVVATEVTNHQGESR
jgi:membrane protein implicated in regulation of membrane protease activity